MFQIIKILALFVAAVLTASCSGTYQTPDPQVRYASLSDGKEKVRLAYRDKGSGKPVLLLHGFGASSYTWRHVEPALVAAGYRVLTVDLKGFGLSEKPINENYSIFDQAALISQFITWMKLKDLTVVGHSLGGGITLALTLEKDKKKRKRISKIVLINSIAYSQNIPIAFSILRTPVLGKVSSSLIPIDVQAHVALRLAYFDNSKFDSQDVKQYADPLKDKGSRHALIQTARKILPENLPEFSNRYKTIKIPALIISCDYDRVIKPDIGLRLHNDLPNSTFRVVRKCGHLPQEEKPQRTIRLIEDFLKN